MLVAIRVFAAITRQDLVHMSYIQVKRRQLQLDIGKMLVLSP